MYYCSHNYSQNARQLTVTPDIQRRYAHVVVNLDDVNKQLNARLESIRTHCESLGFSSEVYGSPDLSTMEQAVKITGECNSKLEATGRYVHACRFMLYPSFLCTQGCCTSVDLVNFSEFSVSFSESLLSTKRAKNYCYRNP